VSDPLRQTERDRPLSAADIEHMEIVVQVRKQKVGVVCRVPDLQGRLEGPAHALAFEVAEPHAWSLESLQQPHPFDACAHSEGTRSLATKAMASAVKLGGADGCRAVDRLRCAAEAL
jgi:hypothetical protein